MRRRPYPEKATPSLVCKTPTLKGGVIIDEHRLSQSRERWKRSIRLNGGPWLGKFEYTGEKEPEFDIAYAESWLYNRLGFHIEERLGQKLLWAGQIYEIDLRYKGWGVRRSLRKVRNAVQVIYTDSNGDTQETSFATNDESIELYGRIEARIALDDEETTLSEAEQERDNALAELSEAHIEPLSVDPGARDRLIVSAQGYVHTANNQYVTAADGTSDDVSNWITEIANTDLEFISLGDIEPNTETVTKKAEIKVRAWTQMADLLGKRPNQDNPPYQLRVTPERDLHYQQMTADPDYIWLNGEVRLPDQSTYPTMYWHMQPGIIRNVRKKKTQPVPGTFFNSGADTLIYELWMGDTMKHPRFRSTRFDDTAFQNHLSIRVEEIEAE